MAPDMVGMISEMWARAQRDTINSLMRNGGLHLASQSTPDDPMLANGVIIDNEFCEVALFDDDASGFDNEEAGFA